MLLVKELTDYDNSPRERDLGDLSHLTDTNRTSYGFASTLTYVLSSSQS